MSSAYELCNSPKQQIMSDTGSVYKHYKIGPRTKPCGTPKFSYCLSDNIIYVVLCGTLLYPKINDAKVSMNNFNIIRSDRLNRSGWRECLHLKNNIDSTHLRYSNSTCELLIVEQLYILLVSMYRSPKNVQMIHLNQW